MKSKKIKCLILIIALFIARSQLYVFSETNNNIQNITGETTQDSNINLDGQIGEWNPNDLDSPNFNQPNLDIDGTRPGENDYYTISVTVPINMRFVVLHNSHNPFGTFYSPEYSITNNGSKTLAIKINKFDRDDATELQDDETLLYINKLNNGDGCTQMELKLSALDSFNIDNNKHIDLTNITSLNDEGKKLFNLEQNETKKVKFSAEKWELPQYESKKDKAISNFIAEFEFSIKESNVVE